MRQLHRELDASSASALTRRQYLRYLQKVGMMVAAAGGSSHPLLATARETQHPLHVLLIGNSRYQHNAALANPTRDVQILAQAFGARGARVQTLLDQTAQQMDAAVTAFLRQLHQSPATLWIGYSGHAVQMDGRNYLQGIDSDFSTPQRVRTFGLNLETIVSLIGRVQPQAAVVSVDACRNNPFEPERTRGLAQGLAPMEPKGICISFSTAPHTKALDGDEGNYSPYAQALAQALAGQQQKSLDQVLRETADAVFVRTRKKQIPEYRSALRAQWWFTQQKVALRSDEPLTPGNSVQNSSTREATYRPDEPRSHPSFSQTTAAAWTELEMQLLMQQQRTSQAQAQQLLKSAQAGPVNTFERLLLSIFLQDGHPGVPRSPRHARHLLQPLADQGHVLGQNLLGESWFAEKAYDLAYKWISLAARSGYSRARTNLGHLHMLGHNNSDPTAGALQALQGMFQQAQERLGPNPTSPQITPELQQEIDRIQQMLRGSGR